MIHRIRPDIRNCHARLSRRRKPILEVDSGDTIIAGTRFCSWGLEPPPSPDVHPTLVKIEDRADPVNDVGNCLVGPIAIRGAKPGMTLEVGIEAMTCASFGITLIGGSPNERYDRFGIGDEHAWMPWVIDREAGTASNLMGHTVKLRPFVGSIGVCPDLPGYINNMAPSKVGGNLDCKELIAGSKLYLPIEVPEALFSFGDGHAAQGDGEIGGSAIECPMEDVTLKLTLRRDFPITYPLARTPDAWITFGFAENLHDATCIAVNNALDLMTAKLGISRVDAAMLAGMIIDLRVTQMVNPTVGVHAVWPEGALIRGCGSGWDATTARK